MAPQVGQLPTVPNYELMENQISIQPSLETVQEVLSTLNNTSTPPNLVPLCATIPSDFLTPETAYLKLSAKCARRLQEVQKPY